MPDTELVCLGKYALNLDLVDALGDRSKVTRFLALHPLLQIWCEEHISSWDESNLKIIQDPYRTYDIVEVWMPLTDPSDVMLWKLRPDHLTYE